MQWTHTHTHTNTHTHGRHSSYKLLVTLFWSIFTRKFHFCNSVKPFSTAFGSGNVNMSTCSTNQSRRPASHDVAGVPSGGGGGPVHASLPRDSISPARLSGVFLFRLSYPPCSVCSVRLASSVLIAPAASELMPMITRETSKHD